MLRQILTTIVLILLPYVIYGIIALVRRRLQQRVVRVDDPDAGLLRGAPVLALGLVGCLLAVVALIAVAVLENDPGQPAYVPPVNAGRSG